MPVSPVMKAGIWRSGLIRLLPLVDDVAALDFHRADFGDAVVGRPPAGGFDIDHDIGLVRVGAVGDTADIGGEAQFAQQVEPGQLVAPDLVAFGLDLDEFEFAFARQHEVGKAVA